MAPNTAYMAANLILVLCCLDIWDIDEGIVTIGMKSVRMGDFPQTMSEYHDCLKMLVAWGQVLLQPRPPRTLRIVDRVQQLVTNASSKERLCAAFDAAVALVSASWPWLTTYNATDVERLHIARKFRSHILELRNFCIRYEPGGFIPGLNFCALLHEQAWLELMQTTVDDMRLVCYHDDFPLAHRILRHHKREALTDPGTKVRYEKLLMNNSLLMGMAASMLGKMDEAQEMLQHGLKLLTDLIAAGGLLEDARTMAFHYLESGLHKLRLVNADESGALKDIQYAINTVKVQKEKSVFKFMLPNIVRALVVAHFQRKWIPAMELLQELLSERGQWEWEDLIFDDVTSLETGIALYALGKVHYFSTPDKHPDVLTEAVHFLRRAVAVLEQTRGDDDIWTLAATYRLAVCLYDREEYEKAVVLLDKLNLAYRDYKGPFRDFDQMDPVEVSDILWQKARVLWKGGRALQALGGGTKELEGGLMVDEAVRMYWEMCGKPADGESMLDSAWDEMVFFLYR